MKKYFAILLISLYILSPTNSYSEETIKQAPTMSVERAVVANSVIDRVPQGVADTFSSNIGKISCFTKIINGGAEGFNYVHHIWYFGDDIMADIKLRVGAASWRTHSTKTIMDEWKGNWKVKIVAPNGDVLDTVKFIVR